MECACSLRRRVVQMVGGGLHVTWPQSRDDGREDNEHRRWEKLSGWCSYMELECLMEHSYCFTLDENVSLTSFEP